VLFHLHKRPRKGQPEAKVYGGYSWIMTLNKINADGDLESIFGAKGRNVLIDPTFGSGINSETGYSWGYRDFFTMISWMPHSKYRLFNAVGS